MKTLADLSKTELDALVNEVVKAFVSEAVKYGITGEQTLQVDQGDEYVKISLVKCKNRGV